MVKKGINEGRLIKNLKFLSMDLREVKNKKLI